MEAHNGRRRIKMGANPLARSARALVVSILSISLVAMSGCSAVFVKGPPDGYETRDEQIECSRFAVPIALDAIVFASSLILMVLVGQSQGANDNDDALHGTLDDGLWAVPSATLIASGTSLFFGGRRIRECHKAQRQIQRRLEREQRASES